MEKEIDSPVYRKGEVDMKKHCMDCGSELTEMNYHESCTKYACPKCKAYWFKTTRIITDWKKVKFE
jgi:predicted RNA-binding Zn-ribbon protein involved in translation (DUF1610 family)